MKQFFFIRGKNLSCIDLYKNCVEIYFLLPKTPSNGGWCFSEKEKYKTGILATVK